MLFFELWCNGNTVGFGPTIQGSSPCRNAIYNNMTIQSPCIMICEVSEQHKICEGCGRTDEEIAQWLTYTDNEKKVIINTLEDRLLKCRFL